MWVPIFLFIISLYTFFETPREWWKNKTFRNVVLFFHAIGFGSILVLLNFFYLIDNQTIRDIIVNIETFYFTFCIHASIYATFRYFLFYGIRHFRIQKITNFISNKQIFISVVTILTILFLIPSVHNAKTLSLTKYDITFEDKEIKEDYKIIFIADLHVGAGSDVERLNEMVKISNKCNPDAIFISGDVCDGSSSKKDLEILIDAISKMKCKDGVYYAEGNHEVECRYDVIPYLESIGVNILKDETVSINEDINIIGRRNSLETSVEKIINDKNEIENKAIICLQHRPKQYKEITNYCDLVLCGHTHGYQYPFIAVIAPFTRDQSYGYLQKGSLQAITTSGVAQWGYYAKWPSICEVVEITIHANH